MNDFKFEKNKLTRHINNEEILNLFKQARCFIAGGAITSIFSGKEINDIDVYFRDFESLDFVLKSLFNESVDESINNMDASIRSVDDDISAFSLIYTNHTTKSILFTKDGLNVQLIYFKFFKSADEIFNTFDFTVNMGAYDCENDCFVLNESFLKDIAQRRLGVNPYTSFPIISLLRIEKYRQKGYSISRKDFVNLCLSVNNLKIESWEDLADAIGGMYGYIYTDSFKTNEIFSIDEAINQLLHIESNLNNVVDIESKCYYDLIEIIKTNLKIIPTEDSFLFYKKVIKTEEENVFSSFNYPDFKYKVGDIVNGGEHGIWAYKIKKLALGHATYGLQKTKEATICLRIDRECKVKRNSDNSYNIKGNVEVVGIIEGNS